jgi:hypothetical protein
MNRRLMAALSGVGIVAASATATLATSAAFSGVSDTRSASAVAGLDTVPRSPLPDDLAADQTSSSRERVVIDEWAYRMGGVGLIVLARDGSGLEVVSVRPEPGWAVSEPRYTRRNGIPRVGIKFTKGNQQVEFVAYLLDGEPVTRAISETTLDATPRTLAEATAESSATTAPDGGWNDPEGDYHGDEEDPKDPEDPKDQEDAPGDEEGPEQREASESEDR